MTKKRRKFGEIVLELMKTRGLKSAEVGSFVGMPTASIKRFIDGKTDNPSANTLLAFARLFNVSVDFLLDNPDVSPPPVTLPSGISKSTQEIPILDWSQVKTWLYSKNELNLRQLNWIPAKDISINSFAITVNKHVLRHIFPMGSTIIIDPETKFKENDFVLASIDTNMPSIKQIVEENGKTYLQSVGVILPSTLLEPPHAVFGKITECRYDV